MTRRDLLAALPALVAGGAASGSAAGANALKVGAALPDPPFEFIKQSGPSGFDIALMQRIAGKLGRAWQLVRYEGGDFNGIFAGLDSGAYDCVASGTTITPAREKVADFCAPYAVSGQSLVVDAARLPQVHGIDDLAGLVIGVQHGNTSALWPRSSSPSIAPHVYAFTPITRSRRRSTICQRAAATPS